MDLIINGFMTTGTGILIGMVIFTIAYVVIKVEFGKYSKYMYKKPMK